MYKKYDERNKLIDNLYNEFIIHKYYLKLVKKNII